MSKWTTDSEVLDERVARAKVVAAAHPDDIGVIEYLRQTNDTEANA